MSSCPCASCPMKTQPHIEQQQPSSLPVSNCQLSDQLTYCSDRHVYKVDTQPQDKSWDEVILNRLGVRLDAQCYTPVTSDSCPCTVYRGTNPLLVDAPRGDVLLLDRPPLTGEVQIGNTPEDEIYTPFYSTYGRNYKNYSDITGGQIGYYLDKDTSNAYFQPNFVTPARVQHSLYVDPMGNVRPEYDRISTTPYNWNECKKDACDSFTHDTLEFRQELMEKQMRKRNEQRYEPRWAP